MECKIRNIPRLHIALVNSLLDSLGRQNSAREQFFERYFFDMIEKCGIFVDKIFLKPLICFGKFIDERDKFGDKDMGDFAEIDSAIESGKEHIKVFFIGVSEREKRRQDGSRAIADILGRMYSFVK